jgi:hypothetical protein
MMGTTDDTLKMAKRKDANVLLLDDISEPLSKLLISERVKVHIV